jgi:hypothetical protein
MIAGTIRPDDWNIALLVHVFGALVLVGTLVLASSALLLAWRTSGGPAEATSLVRLGFRSLYLGVIPGYLVMRIGAEWIVSKEDLQDAKLTWLDIGFTTADMGILVVLIGTLLAGLAVRRAGRSSESGGGGLVGAAAILATLILVAYLVAIWAMTTKPT